MVGTSEAARRLGCSPDTVLRMAQRGELPAVKVGKRYKFRPADLSAYLDRARLGPPAEE
jgi:excisionase family DNA binding protein